MISEAEQKNNLEIFADLVRDIHEKRDFYGVLYKDFVSVNKAAWEHKQAVSLIGLQPKPEIRLAGMMSSISGMVVGLLLSGYKIKIEKE